MTSAQDLTTQNSSDTPGSLSWMRSVFSTSFRKQIAYRVDFWVQFASVIFGSVGLAYCLWSGIYSAQNKTLIGGYSLSGMIFYYAFTPLGQRLMTGMDFGSSAEEIYSGTLTRYLIYPVSLFTYKYVQRLASSLVSIIQYGSFILIYAAIFGVPNEIHISIASVALGVLIAAYGGVFYFCIQLTIEAVAFWQDSVWSLLVMLRFLTTFLGGAILPLSLFPGRLQMALLQTPFPQLISLPIRTMLGQASLPEISHGILILTIWLLICAVLMKQVWSRGLRSYAGVGQ